MKSLKLLPLAGRERATQKQLLEALETAETELQEYSEKSTKVIYKSMRFSVCEISKEIEILISQTKAKGKNVIELEDKVFEKITTHFKNVGEYDKTIDSLRSKITPDEADKIDKESAVHPTLKYAKK